MSGWRRCATGEGWRSMQPNNQSVALSFTSVLFRLVSSTRSPALREPCSSPTGTSAGYPWPEDPGYRQLGPSQDALVAHGARKKTQIKI